MSLATMAQPHSSARTHSVAEIAEILGVSMSTVLTWIKRGELIAICSSKNPKSQKPRFRVDAVAFEQFKLNRMAVAPSTPAPRRRKTATNGVRKFF